MGTSWISRKGGILEKRGLTKKRGGGGMTPLPTMGNMKHQNVTRYQVINASLVMSLVLT